MPLAEINGVKLYYEETGEGDPLVLVHGSWTDHATWELVVPELSKQFRVISYDRRGHSRSSAPAGQGRVEDDVADLAALIEHLDAVPAHVAGNSFGASISIRLAASRPTMLRSLSAHEPPLFGLLQGNPAFAPVLGEMRRRAEEVIELLKRGENSRAAELFVEKIALGPGQWERLPGQRRQVMVDNAPTYLDETQDPQALVLDLARLSRYRGAVQLTNGDQSQPMFQNVIAVLAEALPQAARFTFQGSGHIPQMTDAQGYVKRLLSFLSLAPIESTS
jgi:pimeloyl-ACP methyl ester carboxylesterase